MDESSILVLNNKDSVPDVLSEHLKTSAQQLMLLDIESE